MTLGERVAPGLPPDAILDRFLGWVAERGLEPYPEQEEAILELLADRHVVLSTPTGSGKSLVALAAHFRALCSGARSFYTAPVKALVSEKFFALCDELGAERVGMLTGDASINPGAPVLCATTEVLASMALRGGETTDAPVVVLDEFHYYDDPERGMAWQIPLLVLRHSQFLLMSATLGNTSPIEERLAGFTQRELRHVHSDSRPVPLDFEYRETPLHETLEELVGGGRAPVYVVNFTQRECGDLAQGATSGAFVTREARTAIAEAIGGFRFDTPYGRDVKRFLSHGIGVHHAGLLPKYRLLVEQLAQQGLLRVIFGTDTLGVGVNVPIRSVVLNRLSKFDGEKTALLRAREFHQIAGRAGRKGFDERGSIVCQAPEHVIENRRLEAKARQGGRRKLSRKPAPPGFVPWTRDTFEQLVARPPEMLQSRFDATHGLILSVLQRPVGGDYAALIRLVNRSHESDARKARLRRRAAQLFRSLVGAGVIELVGAAPRRVRVHPDLQTDFSLHDTLSLYLVEAAAALDRASESYALELLSLVEAVAEDPKPILRAQVRRAKGELVAKLKAEGVEYDERMRRLEEVTWPRPEETFLRESFRIFAERHPWVREDDVRPKSIAREIVERALGFRDYVKELELARSEGLLLRYLSQVHNTLVKTIPDAAKSDEVYDVIAFLRAAVQAVDTSLLEAWEGLVAPGPAAAPEAAQAPRFDLARQPRLLTARVRSELQLLVRALAARDYEEAALLLHAGPDEGDDAWDAARLEAALAPFHAECGELRFTPDARQAHHTRIEVLAPRRWKATQVLPDAAGDGFWALHGEIDLSHEHDPEGPLFRLLRVGP